MVKNELNQRFKRLYPHCELFAIHLDGFSHTVFYKDGNGEKHIDGYTAYAPEQYSQAQRCFSADGDFAWKSWNEDKTKVLFLGMSHLFYQNNAKEYVYRDVKKWRN